MVTKEEYEFLKQYEDRINTATKSNYMRAIPNADVKQIGNIYSRIIGEKYSFNEHCGACILKLMQKIAKHYYEYKELEDKQNGETDQTEGNTSGSVDATKEDSGSNKSRKKQNANRGNA